MKIYHDSRNREYRDPFGAVRAGTSVTLALDIADCDARGAEIEMWRDGEARAYLSMQQISWNSSGSRYGINLMMPDKPCLVWYRFLVKVMQDGEIKSLYYGNNEENTGGKGRLGYEGEIEPYQITVYRASEVPEWYTGGIVYQIFPDRFARDADWRERVEKANEHVNSRRSDIKRTVIEDWSQPAYYERDDKNRVVEWPMYGGSLRGIEENLDYIKSLGVTAIYLNPVFEATSNHRYDTGDYMRIDPALGTDEDFRSLAKAAEKRGVRLILDGVFSHTGNDSIYFDRFGNYTSPADGDAEPAAKGAWGNEDSPYRSWYKFDDSEKYGYKSWWGVEDLPEVDENDPGYRKFMLDADGVVARWLRMGASGWRLDVADELPDSFIEGVRERVRKTKPEGLLIGEVWEDASNKISYGERRRYLSGDELDGTMNYPLRDILLDYVNYTIGSGKAAEKLMSLKENYPPENFYAALNLIGSHDRERIITAMAAEEDYDSAVRKVRLLSTLQFALPGVPCVYYGDEAGLTGGADPANRSGYPWGFENLDLGYHYRMLGLLYQEHPALRNGAFRMLSGTCGISDDVFAFTLSGKDAGGAEETLIVLANRSYSETWADLGAVGDLRGGYALELLTSTEMKTDEDGSLGSVRMDRLSSMIISLRKRSPYWEGIDRKAGVICHISSLCRPTLGAPAREFVDFIADAGFRVWQLLPLNPAGVGDSPYSSYAAFAGDESFIDRDELPDMSGYEAFVKNNSGWLYEYIAYMLIKESQDGKPWYEWPEDLRSAGPAEYLETLGEEDKKRAKEIATQQYYFDAQWKALKSYANSRGVEMMGDLPMYMAPDCADVWGNKDIFRMDEDGRLDVSAGVPPDAFSGEGQAWGNPLYNWEKLKENGYDWWMRRMRQCAERYDILRIDHFRGLSEYYTVPEGGTPKTGCWQHGPGLAFIKAVSDMIDESGSGLGVLAEDLGFLDAGVKDLMKLSGLPGMDIWQFNAYEMMQLCEEEPEKAANRAFYTGTHDNNTLIGWLEDLQAPQMEDGDEEDPERKEEDAEELRRDAGEIIGRIYESPACLAMLQMQDVLMLGEDARMNVPGVADGNWKWKMDGPSVTEAYPYAKGVASWLKELAEKTGRTE